MGKRGIGNPVLWVIIELVISIFLAVALSDYAITTAKGFAFDAKFYSQDLAAFAEAVQAVPGNVVVRYPNDLANFKVRFHTGTNEADFLGEKRVDVIASGLTSSKFFATRAGYDFTLDLAGPNIYFYKIAGKGGVSEDLHNLAELDCSQYASGHEPKQLYVKSDSSLCPVEDALRLDHFSTALSCRNEEGSQANIIILLKPGKADSVKAFIGSSPSSPALACSLANSFIDAGVYTSASIIPVNPAYDSDPELGSGKTAVRLELGTADFGKVAEAIRIGLEKYYER